MQGYKIAFRLKQDHVQTLITALNEMREPRGEQWIELRELLHQAQGAVIHGANVVIATDANESLKSENNPFHE